MHDIHVQTSHGDSHGCTGLWVGVEPVTADGHLVRVADVAGCGVWQTGCDAVTALWRERCGMVMPRDDLQAALAAFGDVPPVAP